MPVHIDDAINADWIKFVSWDFFVRSGNKLKRVETLADLLKMLGVEKEDKETQKKVVVNWALKRPSIHAAPKRLKKELIRWLKE